MTFGLCGKDNNGRVHSGLAHNNREPLHALIERERSCVLKAASLVHWILKTPERKRADSKKSNKSNEQDKLKS